MPIFMPIPMQTPMPMLMLTDEERMWIQQDLEGGAAPGAANNSTGASSSNAVSITTGTQVHMHAHTGEAYTRFQWQNIIENPNLPPPSRNT